MARATARKLEATDGRVLRSARSRETIASALFELVGEGNLEPTAEQVAARAEVGIRTVFRHFADMEALYATLDARLLAEVMPLLRGEPAGGPLRERAAALVRDRANLFERIAPYKRASSLQRRRSQYLATQHRKLVSELRERLLRWLPEFADAPTEIVEALDQATSFEAWDRLRSDQRLGRDRARAAMEYTVQAIIAGRAGDSTTTDQESDR
jgi:AcrR family transcriptional regulator